MLVGVIKARSRGQIDGEGKRLVNCINTARQVVTRAAQPVTKMGRRLRPYRYS